MEPIVKNRLAIFIGLLESGNYTLTDTHHLNLGGNNRSLAGLFYETYILLTGKAHWKLASGESYYLLDLGPGNGSWTYEIANSIGYYFGIPNGLNIKFDNSNESICSLNDKTIPEITSFFRILCAG